MYQEIEVINEATDEQTTNTYTEYSEHSPNRSPNTYTVRALAEKLEVSERTIQKYAKKLCEVWSWLPESHWRVDGLYTEAALTEMSKLKTAKTVNDYAQSVTKESGNYTNKGGQLARIETVSTVKTLTASPLPEFCNVELVTVDTSEIRNRTEKLKEINSQLGDAVKQLIAKKVDNKLEELDANLDQFFAELEAFSKHNAVKKIQQNQG